MDKKALAVVLGLTAMASVAYCQVVPAPPWAAMSASDTELFWREASGPEGEQDARVLPLYRAVFAHDLKAAIAMLDRGVSANSVLYPKRWSPLMVAVAYQDKAMVDLLLKRGADIDYVSNDPADYTALGVALNAAIGEALESGKSNPSLDYGMFHHLLDAGANVNVEFGYNSDIAIFAATLGQMNLVNQLLARGYRRDLAELSGTLHIRQVNDEAEPDKQKAIRTIEALQHSR